MSKVTQLTTLDKIEQFWSLIKNRQFSHIRRDYLNWYTKREMTFAYVAGASAGVNDPEYMSKRKNVDAFAEFYITMDLFVDADF